MKLQAQPKQRRALVNKGQRLESAIPPNGLDQEFAATARNQKWATDFTCVWTSQGWLYVAAVLDLLARRIASCLINPRMTANLGTDALIVAIWRRRPDAELLHHSDKGSQYTCDKFRQLLAGHGIECRKSRTAECRDNAIMENLFSRMKDDQVSRLRYQTRDEARADIFDLIKRFCNPIRKHSTLSGLSLVGYEKQAKLA